MEGNLLKLGRVDLFDTEFFELGKKRYGNGKGDAEIK